MRLSLLISAGLHVVLVAALLVSAPRRLEPAPEQFEVELVPEKDAPQPPEEKKEEPTPEKPSVLDFPDQKPKFDLPRLEVSQQTQKNPAPAEAAAKQKQKAAAQEQKAAPQPKQQQADVSVSQQAQPSAANSPQAAPTPWQPAPPPEQPTGFAGEQQATNPLFDPANIPRFLDLPMGQENGFDSEAILKAKLTDEERAAFKAQLRKCWKAPGGLAPATRVVLRVSLRPNGALATEPMLIEASASRDGPVVLAAAKRALKQCQPFGFLPVDRYSEWKVLDLSFTPRDMAGG